MVAQAKVSVALFPGPIYKRRGPGTHCLCMHQVSMVTHYNAPHFSGVTMEIRHMHKQCVPGPLALRHGNEAKVSVD